MVGVLGIYLWNEDKLIKFHNTVMTVTIPILQYVGYMNYIFIYVFLFLL